MGNYLLSAISWLCLLHTGVCSEECSQNVLARRDTVYAPAGSSLSLSCVVLHCGTAWNGKWIWRNPTDEKLTVVQASERHRLANVMLSANETQLILHFLSVNQSDEGFYGCSVTWDQGVIGLGHLMHVNVTAAVPTQRSVLLRVLVCVSAFLCLPIILGLAYCLSSEVKPQPLPSPLPIYAAVYRDRPHPSPQPPPRCPVPQKRSTSSYKAAPKSQQKTEVVYADISQGALGQQAAPREPAQSTVYSSLAFS
ncbi:uncharacterized protein [Chaetodon trifascialis]|uniref:uncharacterized protein n=1 Tax=Chaetodon trifascialis TaxID=109706 RepID=UPI003994EBCB